MNAKGKGKLSARERGVGEVLANTDGLTLPEMVTEAWERGCEYGSGEIAEVKLTDIAQAVKDTQTILQLVLGYPPDRDQEVRAKIAGIVLRQLLGSATVRDLRPGWRP